jgi:NTE family protein
MHAAADDDDDLGVATTVLASDTVDWLRALPLFRDLPAEVVAAVADETAWFTLPGGTTLFDRGEPSDAVYFIAAGALGVLSTGSDGATPVVARLGPGQSVGEMGMVSGRPRSARVVALRDSVVGRLPRAACIAALLGQPAALLRFAELIVERFEQSGSAAARHARPRTLTIVPAGIDVDAGGFALQLIESLAALGRAELVWSVRGGAHTSEWFHRLEAGNDFVVYVTDPGDSPWTRLCTRQADVMLLLARAAAAPGRFAALEQAQFATLRSELVLLGEEAIEPGSAARWRAALPGIPHHHVRDGRDVARVARLVTGNAVGIVLSGGGARGFAHLGVVRALREHGVPIDRVGGTSMGAIMGAGVAADWSHEECVERFRRSFVATNPLSDFTLPVLSLVSGRKVGRLLRREFGEVDIGDLPLPFFCVSTNLTSGRVGVHDAGDLWRWLRASLAIPGVLPPVFHGGEVYVDGGVMNNLPVDVMLERRHGTVIGVDVGADPAFTSELDGADLPPFWRLTSLTTRGRKRPNILQILSRSGMVNSAAASAGLRQRTSVLVRPPLESIDLLNWRAFDRAIEIGYDHTRRVLDAGVELPRFVAGTRDVRRRCDPPARR